jgi:transposase InsO family protein
MRWGVKDVMGQRIAFVIRAASGKERISDLCREFQISRPTGYLWLQRYRAAGETLAAVQEQSRRPKTSPRRTMASVEAQVIRIRGEEGWGAKAIRRVLERDLGIRLGRMTVHRILERHGLICDENRHVPAVKRFEREEPNQLWQMDFKGQFPMGARQCYPLSVLDDHSRYLIGLQALDGPKAEGVHETLVDCFRSHGVPDAMLMDHGTPWWSTTNGHGLTWLSVSLIKQGIQLYYSGIRHPQTQGKVEKFHDTLRRAIEHRNRWHEELTGWQQEFRQYRDVYNHRRPHEALNMDTPVQHYRTAARKYDPRGLPWNYPAGALLRKLNTQGQIYWGRYLFVSEALAGETVRLHELNNKLIVSYRHMLVREIDKVTGQSTPLVLPADSPMQTAAAVENQQN